MFDSIYRDFKYAFSTGNMIVRIIMVNVIFFIAINLLNVFDFDSQFHLVLIRKLAVISDPLEMLLQFWGLVTNMFVHKSFWHILWNMLFLYWFGRIVGDLLGDQRILPLYLLGGIGGGLMFFLWAQFSDTLSIAYGASAAVWALTMVAAMTAPDYEIRLILIGSVRIKYVVAVLLFLDLLTITEGDTSGSYAGHMGGVLTGVFFMYMLQRGVDITEGLQRLFDRLANIKTPGSKSSFKRKNFTVYKNEDDRKTKSKNTRSVYSKQAELDRILDKINSKGYDSLTQEEKDFLYQASKNK